MAELFNPDCSGHKFMKGYNCLETVLLRELKIYGFSIVEDVCMRLTSSL